jgi:hypothetical protein
MRNRTEGLTLLAAITLSLAGCDQFGAGSETMEEIALEVASSAPYAPAPADFDGDGKADPSFRDAGGIWWINLARNGVTEECDLYFLGYGGTEATPVPAD